MLKLNQKSKVKWCSRNKNRLVSLGYNFTHMGDEIEVKVEHLSQGSPSRIIYICDYCGKEVETSFMTYNKGHKYSNKDACKECANLKSRDAFKIKYGVTNPLQVPSINQKQRDTCFDKYGVEYALQNKDLLNKKNNTCVVKYGTANVLLNEEIASKKKETCIAIYGCETPSQNPLIQEKIRQTNLDRYGVKHSMQSSVIQEKLRQTFMERYGVEYCLQNKQFAIKQQESMMKTMCRNGTVPTSKAQLSIYNMCTNIDGIEYVELNKPLGVFALDVAIVYKGQLVDIEYDGTFWHRDKQKDRRRDEIVKTYGYKILRFRGRRNPPTLLNLIKAIDNLVKSKHTFKLIELDI